MKYLFIKILKVIYISSPVTPLIPAIPLQINQRNGYALEPPYYTSAFLIEKCTTCVPSTTCALNFHAELFFFFRSFLSFISNLKVPF